VRFAPESLVEQPVDATQLGELFRQWGFHGMLKLWRPGGQTPGGIDLDLILNCKKR